MKKIKGVTLLELMLVAGIIAIGTLMSLWNKQADLEQQQSRQVGLILSQYNNAVRNYLAKHSDTPSGIKIGSTWLKNTNCGGPFAPNAEYLQCSFPDASTASPIKFGQLSLTTVIQATGTSPNRRVSATTTTTPFKILKNRDLQVRSDLSGIAAMTAAAGSGINYDQNAAATAVTSDASYSSNPITAQITMVASNSADNDIWLRTDGGNQMHAPLRFDSAIDGNREIIGVSRIQNLSAQILHLGSPSGVAAASGAGLIVDTDSEIIGNLRIIKELKVDNGASVTGSVSATANVVAQQNVVAGQASSAQIFYDANNSSYYVDPDKVSNLNSLAANYISSKGRLRTEEYLELGGVATPGKGCSPNGLLGRTPDGKPLSCESGTWRRLEGGLDGPYQVSGTYLGNWKLCTLNYTSGNSKQVYYDGSQWIWKGSGTQLVYCYK